MAITQKTRLLAALAVMLPLAWRTSTSQADVTFFIQREGSPDDNGLALFIQAVGAFQEQDFEGPEFAPDGVEVRKLRFGRTKIKLARPQERPLLPFTFSSGEFDAPGRFFGRALVCGIALRITAHGRKFPRGLGMWIFDDLRALDSAYLIEVTEKNGARWQAVLENQIELSARGHEIEGFIGAVSDQGIRAMTITPIDPLTGMAQPDVFEIDHLLVAAAPHSHDDDDDEDDNDEHGDDDAESDEDGDHDDEGDDEDDDSASSHGRHDHNTPHRSFRTPRRPQSATLRTKPPSVTARARVRRDVATRDVLLSHRSSLGSLSNDSIWLSSTGNFSWMTPHTTSSSTMS